MARGAGSGRVIFNTWAYAAFVVVAFALHWGAPPRLRPFVLLGLGAYFYRYYYPPHLLLVLASIPLVFGLAHLIARRRDATRGHWLALGVALCLGALAYYKYQGFFLDVVERALGVAGVRLAVEAPALRPPLGISFFVFEYVHYLVEVSRGTFTPGRLRDLALFVMFFPTLICGPIKRYERFQPQEYSTRRLDAADVHAGLERILFGLAKKTLVADAVAPYCAQVFAHPEQHGWATLWLAVYGYALQIYFDFSGYSDIAIGSARLFGYTVPENFDFPYLQPNIARFWRAWHMSLTSWITDYVYVPLGGNRQGEGRAAWNRLVSMTLCGLWHGAAFHFAVWGLYHGVMLNLYRGFQTARVRLLGPPRRTPPVPLRVLGTLLTFHVVCLGWVLFVCDLPVALGIMARLFGLA
jgi:alginate O-acetyltransferase complex protein AlgI